ncbi:TetR/AcrR family transcriptional regulator [Chitinimonas sp.]|uniref:TetR/AcrR family transcriptional regulator n=1 Tax=Chitinimonas sp. TaxID=1934313 RepID=UPI002F91F108
MKKSKADTAETRKRIVLIASRLFLERGLAATGIADVMKEAGLTQGGFYRHFESKEQLIAEANEMAFDQIFTTIGKEVAGQGLGPKGALDKIVQAYLYQHHAKQPVYLCPMANLGSELPHADEQVKAIVNVGYRRLVGYIEALIQQMGVPNQAAIADTVFSTMLGAVTAARLALTESSSLAILDNARQTIDLIVQSAQKAQAHAPA